MAKLFILIIIAALVFLYFPQIQRRVLAGMVLHDLIPQFGSKWLPYFARPVVTEHPVIEVDGIKMETNLFRPNDKEQHAAIVYIHGVNDLGKDDPRLVNLAQTFTRAGYAVIIPGLPDMSPGKLNPQVIPEIEESIKYMSGRKDIVDDKKIGVLGFSIGSGPSMIAVSNINPETTVSFLISFGGYWDLSEVIKFATTGHFSYQGQDHFIEPDSQSRWFFVRYYSDFIENQNDSNVLKQIAAMKIADPNADVSNLADQLSSEGKSIYDLITNTDSVKVNELINNLPEKLKAFITALNPKDQVKTISSDFYIIHSLNDNIIPYTQSLELYDNYKGNAKTELFLLKIFSHVNPVFPKFTPQSIFSDYIPEIYKFWKLIYDLLGYRG